MNNVLRHKTSNVKVEIAVFTADPKYAIILHVILHKKSLRNQWLSLVRAFGELRRSSPPSPMISTVSNTSAPSKASPSVMPPRIYGVPSWTGRTQDKASDLSIVPTRRRSRLASFSVLSLATTMSATERPTASPSTVSVRGRSFRIFSVKGGRGGHA